MREEKKQNYDKEEEGGYILKRKRTKSNKKNSQWRR